MPVLSLGKNCLVIDDLLPFVSIFLFGIFCSLMLPITSRWRKGKDRTQTLLIHVCYYPFGISCGIFNSKSLFLGSSIIILDHPGNYKLILVLNNTVTAELLTGYQ